MNEEICGYVRIYEQTKDAICQWCGTKMNLGYLTNEEFNGLKFAEKDNQIYLNELVHKAR